MSDPPVKAWKVAVGIVLWPVLILQCEFLSIILIPGTWPMPRRAGANAVCEFLSIILISGTGHRNSWSGIWLSLGVVALSANWLSNRVRAKNWLFVYGCGTCLLLVPRFMVMQPFHDWMKEQPLGVSGYAAWWLAVMCALGTICWVAGNLRPGSVTTAASPQTEFGAETGTVEGANPFATSMAPAPRLQIIHLFLWITCVAVYLGLRQWLDRFSPFAAQSRTPWAISSILYSVGVGAGLAGVALFFARRLRAVMFPSYPGEFLLLSLGVRALLGFAAFGYLVVVYTPRGYSTFDSYRSLAISSALLSTLLLLAGVRGAALRWRWCLWLLAGLSLLGLLGNEIDTQLAWLYPIEAGASFSILTVTALLDVRRGGPLPWTHWAGVAAALWTTVVSLGTSLISAIFSQRP